MMSSTTMEPMTPPSKLGPGNWRWVVLVAAFLNQLLNVSICYGAGVFNVAVVERFGIDPVKVSWLMSLYTGVMDLCAPVASGIINLTDCRTCVVLSGILGLVGFVGCSLVDSFPWLFLTFGLASLGHALAQTGDALIVAFYFPNDLAAAHGVSLAGSGLGCFLYPYLSQVLIDTFGFKGAMLMLGGIAFHSSAFSLLFRPPPLEIKSKINTTSMAESRWKVVLSKIIPPADVFKIPAFCTFIPAVLLFAMAFLLMVVFLPVYLKTYVGLSAQEASVAAMTFGGGSVTSRLFAGFAASDERIGDSLMFVGMAGLLSVLSFCGHYVIQLHNGPYIYSFFYGLYSGGAVSLACSMSVGIVGVNQASHGISAVITTFGFGSVVGPPLVAWLVQTQGPHMLFISCGMIGLVCASFGLMTTYLRQVNAKNISDVNFTLSVEAKEAMLPESETIPTNPKISIQYLEKNEDGQTLDDDVMSPLSGANGDSGQLMALEPR